jgi:hypothetical protein
VELRYTALQGVTVYTSKPGAVRVAMNRLVDLGKQGIVFSGGGYQGSTQYLFTKLNELKPGMIEEATRKAREVAEKFARDSDSRLGKIKSAQQGQFTISDRDSNCAHQNAGRLDGRVLYPTSVAFKRPRAYYRRRSHRVNLSVYTTRRKMKALAQICFWLGFSRYRPRGRSGMWRLKSAGR